MVLYFSQSALAFEGKTIAVDDFSQTILKDDLQSDVTTFCKSYQGYDLKHMLYDQVHQ